MSSERPSRITIVIDTSVILAVACNEPSKPRLIELPRGADLIGPRSIPFEIGNALSAMLKRKRINPQQAKDILTEYARIRFKLMDVTIDYAVQLAAELNIYAYDAYMIQCAKVIAQPLLTLDVTLRQAAQRVGVETLEI